MNRQGVQEASIIDDPSVQKAQQEPQPTAPGPKDAPAGQEATGRVLTIAEFTDNYGPAHSGLLYAVHFLEEQVLAAGHKLLLVAPVAKGPNPFAGHDRRREIRLPSVQLPGTGVRISLGQDFDYRLAQLVANPPDVIHVHGLGAIGLLGMWVAERTGKPLIITWHTDFEAYADHYWHMVPIFTAAYKVYKMHLNGTWKELKRLRFKPPRRGGAQVELLQVAANMLADADLVTTPSTKTANRVLEIAPHAKVRVVPSGTDPLPATTPIPRAKGPRLLYVGRISAEKGIELLLDAFELVRDNVPDAELMIVGQWESTPPVLRNKLKRAQRHGRVRLAGSVPREKLGGYYASADLFVFPSLTDTQALVLHEAAHAGLPIVLVDDELRLVVDPGVNAELARPNAVSLAGALIRMLSRLSDKEFAERAAARSRELASQWTIASQSRQFVDIYEAVAAGRPVPLTDNLSPHYGRQIFPHRKVKASLEPGHESGWAQDQPS